jgi:hypothetical protein
MRTAERTLADLVEPLPQALPERRRLMPLTATDDDCRA